MEARTTLHKLIFVVILLGTILVAAAQEPKASPPSPTANTGAAGNAAPSSAPSFKATSRLVLLDVVVTDLNGQFVSGLTKNDFTVLEDGTPQQITSFEGSAEHPRNPISNGQAPVNIFVLDELNTAFTDMAYSRDQLMRYLRKQPARLNQPSALVVVNNTEFKVLQNYTWDRDLLLEVLKKHAPHYPWKLQKGFGIERLDRSLLALRQIAAATMGIPGRKTVIWVGVGFPAYNLIGYAQNVKDTMEAGVDFTINRLLEARVTIYPIDPTIMNSMRKAAAVDSGDPDMGVFANLADDPFDSDVNLANFGPATGGRSFHWRNNIDEVIQASVDDSAKYYTLAYVPNNRSDTSKFRSIRIKLRPGLIARTRNGYYPTDVPMTKDMMSRDIYDASLNTLPYTGLPVTVTGKVTQDTVACTLYINAQAVSWQSLPNGDSHAQLRIASASFSADKLLDYEVKEKESTIPAANFKAVLQRPLAVHVEVPLSKGVKRLRFVIRDEATGHMGAVDVDPNNIPTAAEMPKLFSEQ